MQDQCKKKATYLKERWYLSAIDYLIIDTQVARRGRQYHSNPPPYKKPSYKSNRPTKYTTRKSRKKTPPPPRWCSWGRPCSGSRRTGRTPTPDWGRTSR